MRLWPLRGRRRRPEPVLDRVGPAEPLERLLADLEAAAGIAAASWASRIRLGGAEAAELLVMEVATYLGDTGGAVATSDPVMRAATDYERAVSGIDLTRIPLPGTRQRMAQDMVSYRLAKAQERLGDAQVAAAARQRRRTVDEASRVDAVSASFPWSTEMYGPPYFAPTWQVTLASDGVATGDTIQVSGDVEIGWADGTYGSLRIGTAAAIPWGGWLEVVTVGPEPAGYPAAVGNYGWSPGWPVAFTIAGLGQGGAPAVGNPFVRQLRWSDGSLWAAFFTGEGSS